MRFQGCPIAPLDSYAGPITMMDGRTVDSGDIRFDQDSHTFSINGVDVTSRIKQSDKAANFSGFDRATDNERAYRMAQLRKTGMMPPPTGETSTTKNFFSLVTTDPLGAPIEYASKKADQITKSSGIQTLIIAGIVGYGLILYLQSRK